MIPYATAQHKLFFVQAVLSHTHTHIDTHTDTYTHTHINITHLVISSDSCPPDNIIAGVLIGMMSWTQSNQTAG